ncbi:hypothetical protein KW787_03390, partial [Candidatus Pacearchaeota archaeon]|nr:hypothetical protein [Candidatus Pacearchaeota archaeon]
SPVDSGLLSVQIQGGKLIVTATSESCGGMGRIGTTITTLDFGNIDIDRDRDAIPNFYDICPDLSDQIHNPAYEPFQETSCTDNIDNDCNGGADCGDWACRNEPTCVYCEQDSHCPAPTSSCVLAKCSSQTNKCQYTRIAADYQYGPNQCNVHSECISNSCQVVMGSGVNECNDVAAACDPKHSICENNQCVIADGEGVNTCAVNDDCLEKHAECLEQFGHLYQCVQVNGPGPDQCSGPQFSQCDPFHTECSAGSCIAVLGPGEKRCNYDQQCGAQHADCVNNQCQIVNGLGLDTCALGTSCIGSYAKCQNYQCVVAQGSQTDECSTNADCDTEHTECLQNQCRIIQGPGIDECNGVGAACQVKHAECVNSACISVEGAGVNRCKSSGDCIQSYGQCTTAGQCISKQGIGVNECLTNAECGGDKHSVCTADNQCAVVSGAGTDRCADISDCISTHADCLNNACEVVAGPGIDSCTWGTSCSPMYAKCVNNQCVAVPGTNADECSSTSDCQIIVEKKITAVFWTDFQGDILTSASRKSSIGDSLYLIAQTSGLSSGTEISFDIKESDPGLNPFNPDDDIKLGLKAVVNNSGAATLEWESTDDDYNIRSKDVTEDEYSDKQVEYYFVASASGINNRSDIRNVTKIETNTPPEVNIIAPQHRQMYFVDTPLDFSVDSSDAQGQISRIEWKIEEDGFTSSSATFTHSFNSPGQKTITVKVYDNDEAWTEKQVAILVLAGPGMLTYINEPQHREVIVNESFKVTYRANDSYVVDSSGGTCPTVICKAGNCPQKTQNAPSGCGQFISVDQGPKDFGSLYANWSFDNGNTFEGFGLIEGVQTYGFPSQAFNDKKVDLQLNYTGTPKLGNHVSRIFTLLGKSQCMGGQYLVLTDDEGFLLEKTYTGDSAACRGLDGIIGSADDCCPGGYACTTLNDGTRCVISQVNQCSDYQDEGTCAADPAGVGDPNRPNPQTGNVTDPAGFDCGSIREDGTVVQCGGCRWDATRAQQEPAKPSCYLDKHYENTKTQCIYDCAVSEESQSECVNGLRSITIIGDVSYVSPECGASIDASSCQSTSDTIPCGQAVALPFFDKKNVATVIIILLLIYSIYLARNKHKRRR